MNWHVCPKCRVEWLGGAETNCPECGSSLEQRCPECGRSFDSLDTLTYHKIAVHDQMNLAEGGAHFTDEVIYFLDPNVELALRALLGTKVKGGDKHD